jgi:antitoxin HicB
MFALTYPAILKPDPSGPAFTVNFPDLPEALTDGRSLTEALDEAADCLGEALAGRIVRREEIPPPSAPRKRHHLITVPLYLAPKLALYVAMREQGVSNSELARRLRCSETVVRRMLDPKHDSKPEKLQAALAALGKRVLVTIEQAA